MTDTIKLPSGSSIDFSGPALVMAIVNCNDDSFYAPSRALGDNAVEKALAAEVEGASIVDFGAESSRPGAAYIGADEELARLLPVVEAFRKHSRLPVSVDTRKAVVAAAVLDAGADIINDISGLLDDPAMARTCAGRGAAVVLMHKKGVPLTMQENPFYKNLVEGKRSLTDELRSWFNSAIEWAIDAGVSPEKIILDPGIGFGKNLEHNIEILRYLVEICGKDYPVLIGLSRKCFIGEITGRVTAERLAGTLAANAAAIIGGADIVRVHDVKEHVDLAKVLFALRTGS